MQTFSSLQPSSTSSFVTASDASPLTFVAYRTTTPSNQPQRRARPAVDPNSFPRAWSPSPTASVNSVGNGPLPTPVVYAVATPSTASILVGPTPVPVEAPPAVELEEVT